MSDSAGLVSHFPANHVVVGDEWDDCLSIALPAGSDGDVDTEWDRLLAEHNHAWSGSLQFTPYTTLVSSDDRVSSCFCAAALTSAES